MAEVKAAIYALIVKYGYSKAHQMIEEALSQIAQEAWDNQL